MNSGRHMTGRNHGYYNADRRMSQGTDSRLREDTVGLPEKQRFPTLEMRPKSENDRKPDEPYPTAHRSRLRSSRQESQTSSDLPRTRGGHPLRRGPRSEFPPRTAREPGQSPARSFNRERPQSGRPQRSRASRDDDGGRPRRRKREGQPRTSSDAGDFKDVSAWTEAEEEYFAQKEEKEGVKPIDFEPEEVGPETFSGVSPASVASEQGMSEILGERLRIAKKCLAKEFIEWQSREQKADVLTLVERLKGEEDKEPNALAKDNEANHNPASGELVTETPSTPSGEVKKQTEALMQKLLGGKYVFTGPREGKDILGNVARLAERNESYYPDDQKSLLAKVKSLMPVANSAGRPKTSSAEARR